MLRHVPSYARLAWRLAREPLLSRARRAGVVAAAGYLASPIDAVPGVIPVLGQLDDVAVALAAIRFALAGLSAERRAVHLEAVGLTDADLREDVRTVGLGAAWAFRQGGRLGIRAGAVGIRAGLAGARAAALVGRRAAGPAAGFLKQRRQGEDASGLVPLRGEQGRRREPLRVDEGIAKPRRKRA